MNSKLGNASDFDGFCPLETLEKLDIHYFAIEWGKMAVNKKMRAILVDWLIDVTKLFTLSQRFNTLFLTFKILDLFLSRSDTSFTETSTVITDKNLQLCGVACLYLAAKQQEIYPIEVNDLVHMCDGAYSKEEICKMELEIFTKLQGRINYPTIIDYSRIFSHASCLTSTEHNMVKYLGVVSALDMDTRKYSTKEISVALNWIVCNASPDAETRRVKTDIPTERVNLCCRDLFELILRVKRSSLKAAQTHKIRDTGFGDYAALVDHLQTYIKYPRKTKNTPNAPDQTPDEFLSLPQIDSKNMAKLQKLGEGAYGKVLLVRMDGKNKVVKKSINRDETDGLTSSFIRELNAFIAIHVLGMNGVHTVECFGFHVERGIEYIFLEEAESSLRAFLDKWGKLADDLVLRASKELFRGLGFLHSIGIMHRDLKPQNILMVKTPKGGHTLKICDLGLVRGAGVVIAHGNAFTNEVCTLWYRPPELFLTNKNKGKIHYGPEIDVWSMTCVIAEMVTGQALFPGDTEIDMLFRICRERGFSDKFKSAYDLTASFNNMKTFSTRSKASIPVLEEILEKGLECHPKKRITARQAYELLMKESKDPMQIEPLTPPKA